MMKTEAEIKIKQLEYQKLLVALENDLINFQFCSNGHIAQYIRAQIKELEWVLQ